MNKEIELVNAIVEEAIEHGGDPEGPYFCNDKKLRKAINDWLEFKNFNKDYNIAQPPVGTDWEWEWASNKKEYWKLIEQAEYCQIKKKGELI